MALPVIALLVHVTLPVLALFKPWALVPLPPVAVLDVTVTDPVLLLFNPRAI